MTEYICEKCREAVAGPAVDICPNCGWNPHRFHRRRRWLLGVPGFFLTISVIFSPIGLPLQWSSWKHHKQAKNASPAVAVEPEG